ncbi:hypothetical protein IEQ34_002475 [Dendrobium chrysotoxum]|uniref:Uncharacterized protein n=1 Tax=Dendrobium chrysotoxum TaxID=161865 RepID=A0AAV7HME0_DENCH|nr:hypothetical protein IEQ34_002475 [Dendrobium chrysotoxum]
MAVELTDGFWEDCPTDGALLLKPLCFGEAAGVGGAAVAEMDGVHHSVAVEKVVTGDGLEKRVSAVAEVDAVNEGRDAAFYRKVMMGLLLANRGEIAGDLDGGVGGLWERVTALKHVNN